jgi:epoxyqueuosine reductase QueG
MNAPSIGSNEIKALAMELGADLCGIAPVDRFEGAPTGHHPRDIYPDCRSVIVLAKRIPVGLLYAKSCVPYTQTNRLVNQELDELGIALSLALEDRGMRAVPLPCDDPYEHWEATRKYGMGLLSMRHAGHLAGLGVLGRNTLLKNDRFGNMIKIGAILVDAALEPDPIASYEGCPPHCRLCLDSCPAQALDGTKVDQDRCRSSSSFVNERGFHLTRCNTCRRVCPQSLGIKKRGSPLKTGPA